MGFRGRFSGLNLQIGSSLRSHGLVTFCRSEGVLASFLKNCCGLPSRVEA